MEKQQQGLYPQVDPGYPQQQPQPGYPQPQPGYPPQQPQGYAQPPGYQPVPQKPGDPGYGQSQGTVIVTQPATVVAAPREQMPSPVGSIIFSCCVFWCCCWPLGCIAFIFAVLGAMAKTRVDAVQKIGIANKISIAGLVCGVIIIIIIIVIQVTTGSQASNSNGY